MRGVVVELERQRLAEDLQSGVLHEIFATTLQLASAETRAEPDVAARLAKAVDALDDAMVTIRQTIVHLQAAGRLAG